MKHTLIEIKNISLGWIKKYVLKYRMEDGTDFNYDLVTRNVIDKPCDLAAKNNAVTIICYDKNKNFLLLKEFRYAVNDYVIDFPAGLIDNGESVVKAAKRELFEETGLSGNVTYVLDGGFSSAGMTDEKVAVCMIEVDNFNSVTNKNVEGNEDIEYMICSLSELELVANTGKGKISNRVQFFMLGIKNIF